MILVMNDLQAGLIKISTDLYNHNIKTMERNLIFKTVVSNAMPWVFFYDLSGFPHSALTKSSSFTFSSHAAHKVFSLVLPK